MPRKHKGATSSIKWNIFKSNNRAGRYGVKKAKLTILPNTTGGFWASLRVGLRRLTGSREQYLCIYNYIKTLALVIGDFTSETIVGAMLESEEKLRPVVAYAEKVIHAKHTEKSSAGASWSVRVLGGNKNRVCELLQLARIIVARPELPAANESQLDTTSSSTVMVKYDGNKNFLEEAGPYDRNRIINLIHKYLPNVNCRGCLHPAQAMNHNSAN